MLKEYMLFRNPSKAIHSFFKGIDFETLNWLTFAVNQREDQKERMVAQWEMRGDKELHLLKISYDPSQPKTYYIDAWSNQKKKFIGEVDIGDYQSLFSDFLNLYMEKVRSHLIEATQTPSSQSINPTNEPQGLEWIRTSLLVLKDALKKAFTQPQRSDDSINKLEVLLFSGKKPNSETQTFRLRIFNLDFEIIEDKSNTLRLTVINKGRSESFIGLEPTFTGFFTKSKQPVANEFIQLLAPLASAFNNTFFL